MSSADVEIHRMQTGWYEERAKQNRSYCLNCGKVLTNGLFHVDFCTRGCEEAYGLKRKIEEILKLNK